MTGLTTLKEVNDQVAEMSKDCNDHLIRVEDLYFDDLDTVVISGYRHPLRVLAQKSMAYRLAIPYEYLRRCPAGVQAYNLNYWLPQERNAELFFRFDGDHIRAIFTPKYQPVDNQEVLDKLAYLGYDPDTPVQCHLDQEFMSLSIPDGRTTYNINGDQLVPGISIANSEVGLSSLRIAAFFLRLACTNGLIVKTQIAAAYRHVSRKILEKFPEVMNEVSSQASQQQEKFRLSLQSRVDDPYETLQAFNRQFQLGKLEQDAVTWGYDSEPGPTMFHLVNAYTRAAHYPDLPAAARYHLQQVGGNILAMVK